MKSSKTKINALIVDDEKHARENLKGMLEEYCPGVNIIGLAEGPDEALAIIESKDPDLVFLDVKLTGSTGFDLLESIKTRQFAVIFVTAYDNYAIKAIKFSAVDYLLKPIDHHELSKAVKRFGTKTNIEKKAKQLELLIENLSIERAFSRLGINLEDKTEFLVVKDILRLQGESNYTRIFFNGGQSMLTSKTLVEFEDLLGELGFLRVHKTHLVNIAYIKSFSKKSNCILLMNDETQIPVSRRRKLAVTQILTLKK